MTAKNDFENVGSSSIDELWQGCTSLSSADFEEWDFSNVVTMEEIEQEAINKILRGEGTEEDRDFLCAVGKFKFLKK